MSSPDRHAAPSFVTAGFAMAGLVTAAALVLAPVAARAVAQVPGPIEIGPSWGDARAPDRAARLYTTITNHGVLADRLTGGSCHGFGRVELTNLDPATQGNDADSRGVLLPPGGVATLGPDHARLDLSDATDDAARALAPGDLVSCTLSFVHSGQRLVVFRLGASEPATPEP